MNTTKDKISDLVSYDGSSHTSTVMDYNFLLNQIKNLDSSITQYESNHASQDLVAFKELLAATKALITEHAGKTRTVGTYQSGDFAKLKSVQRFAIAYKQATKQMESRVESVKAAQERDKVRFEALAAEDRAKNGWKELGLGVLTFAIGFIAIIGTMGTATPLVVAGGIVGFGTSVYGLSNAAEGVHNIELGNAGDIHTKSKNPIRDTLFMGNDKLYHDVGNVFVTASAIMIPIGQTQSVVKGLTQFAIGEASAYTAGQVAYHGTKLLGGSEEDAQTANFIGNIVGGYTASSAASKFSLNKVKVDVEAPKYNREQILKNIEESRLARESSKFKQYVAKEKSIIDSWNQNTSKFKMHNMDDLAKPKYNREQILRNIEESKLARESSKFKQYVAKEKSIIDSWNRNTSQSKMHNMDDLAKPKYNREQIIRNIEESRLARESSKFKQYVAKEKSIIDSWNRNTSKSPIKNMPLEEYEMYRTKSVINPESDTMTLGKYEPTIRPDGTQDWSTPGPNSYISKAGDTTYFSLGDDWNKITAKYGLDAEGKDMFKYFNQPALDDAVAQGKTIRFSHKPTLKMYEKSAIRWEWDYLHEQYGYTGPYKIGEFWYAIK